MNSNNTINDIICQLHFVLKQLTEIVEKLSSPENQPETNEKLSRTFTVDRSEHITFKATSKVLSCVEELRKKKHYLKKIKKRRLHCSTTTSTSKDQENQKQK